MGRPIKQVFVPQNPQKYTGNQPIIARRSWELSFMQTCDLRPEVIRWASEPLQIPYRDPLTGNQKVYIPDFLVTRIDKTTKRPVTRLIEVKPMHEQLTEHARNNQDAAIQARNRAKWGAAVQWCNRRGIQFDVFNESHLFLGGGLKKGRAHPVAEYAPGLNVPKKKAVKKPRKKASPLAKLRKRAARVARKTPKAPRIAKVKKS